MFLEADLLSVVELSNKVCCLLKKKNTLSSLLAFGWNDSSNCKDYK